MSELPASDVRERPPADPMSPPSSSRIPLELARSSPKPTPVLASVALCDEAAPLEPANRRIRKVLFAVGFAFLAVGGASYDGRWRDVVIALVAGFYVIGLAFLPYAVRAWGGAIAASSLAGAGLFGTGPLSGFRAHPAFQALQFAAIIGLSTGLLLRATYRTSRQARVAVAVGIVLFLVAGSTITGTGLTWSGATPLSSRLSGLAMAIVAALSLLAFMGEETTGGTGTTAVAAVLMGALLPSVHAHLALSPPLRVAVASLSGLALSTLAVTAAYQLAALVIGPRAHAAEQLRMRAGAVVRDEEHDEDAEERAEGPDE